MKRRVDVVGIFPSEASILRLIGAVLLEANDEWQLQHRYMGVEAMVEILIPALANDTPTTSTQGRLSRGRLKRTRRFHHIDGHGHPGFNGSSQHLHDPLAAARRAPRPVCASRASCAAWR